MPSRKNIAVAVLDGIVELEHFCLQKVLRVHQVSKEIADGNRAYGLSAVLVIRGRVRASEEHIPGRDDALVGVEQSFGLRGISLRFQTAHDVAVKSFRALLYGERIGEFISGAICILSGRREVEGALLGIPYRLLLIARFFQIVHFVLEVEHGLPEGRHVAFRHELLHVHGEHARIYQNIRLHRRLNETVCLSRRIPPVDVLAVAHIYLGGLRRGFAERASRDCVQKHQIVPGANRHAAFRCKDAGHIGVHVHIVVHDDVDIPQGVHELSPVKSVLAIKHVFPEAVQHRSAHGEQVAVIAHRHSVVILLDSLELVK